jgi:hypothetical protein
MITRRGRALIGALAIAVGGAAWVALSSGCNLHSGPGTDPNEFLEGGSDGGGGGENDAGFDPQGEQ